MAVIGILGRHSRETADCLREIIHSAGDLSLFSIVDLERLVETAPIDILVASGGSDIAHGVIESQVNRFFIINPDQKDILACATNSQSLLITYGFNNKVCVTASSVMENEIQICVQRELPTLSGGLVEQQEFGIEADTEKHSSEILLAAISAALVADVQVMVLK